MTGWLCLARVLHSRAPGGMQGLHAVACLCIPGSGDLSVQKYSHTPLQLCRGWRGAAVRVMLLCQVSVDAAHAALKMAPRRAMP